MGNGKKALLTDMVHRQRESVVSKSIEGGED